ncbi:MAG TPA: hypothetical protein VIO64_21535 [Pseudobacteroides sp.]|uniref:hypothetical protein n=1 Tax=Pseudobacteroides sp. TaxID=1968840 RepID=UPI002F92D5AD
MRPLKPKKSVEGISRAKMYIKRDLDLFIGYPNLNGKWISQPQGKEVLEIVITREDIHKATFTINKLVRDFPKALPKIVGDVEKWSDRYKSLLEILKLSIHNKEALPQSLNRNNPLYGDFEKKLYNKIIRENPSLVKVIDCISWLTFLNPETLRDALIWTNSYSRYIDRIYKNFGHIEGMKLIVKLRRLSIGIGEKRTEIIFTWLTDPRISNIIMDQGYKYSNLVDSSLGKKRTDPVPGIPKARFGNDYKKWIDWLSMQDNQTARRSIDLFDLVCDIVLLDRWEEWWKSLDKAINSAKRIPRDLGRHNPLTAKLNNIREKIKVMGKNTPPVLNSKFLFNLLMNWSQNEKFNRYKKMYKVLSELPKEYDNVSVRFAFWIYWDHLMEQNKESKQKIVGNIIDEFCKFVRMQKDFKRALSPWRRVLDSWRASEEVMPHIFTFDDEILDEIEDHKSVSLVFSLLGQLYQDKRFGEFTGNEDRRFVLLCLVMEEEHVLDSFFELRKYGISDTYIEKDILKLSAEITRGDYSRFGFVTKALLANVDRYYDHARVLRPILKKCSNSYHKNFVSDAIEGGQIRALCSIALEAGIVEFFGENAASLPPLLDPEIGWIGRYPKELHEELISLACMDENAVNTANRLLAKYYPDPEMLRGEIEELQLKINNGQDWEGYLKLRTDKLKRRLTEGPVKLGEGKLNNLSKKIRHAGMMGLLERFKEDNHIFFKKCLAQNLNLDEFPDWLQRKDIQEAILSSVELDVNFRGIVTRILKRRATSMPWDFRDEEANSQFIERMKSINVDMTPWIDGDDKLVRVLPDGEEIVFSIERDPIEIFNMGKHFKTCLSPGDINFFSVFSNIIDINKQVIYGRTRSGHVKARALIVLTDDGGILTFYPYCNYGKINFKDILKEFVHNIAFKMNTVVMQRGTVSKLIAPRWYDDGPYDLVGEFPFAQDQSEFRIGLSKWNNDEVLENMLKAVEPIGLNERTIPLFVSLPEIKECKALVEVIYPFVLKLKVLSSDSFLNYLQVLLDMEKWDMLQKLLPKIVDHVLSTYREGSYWSICEWVELLLKISPVKALYIIKKTRSQNSRNWEDEECERIAAVGRAYLMLNRPKQAAKMFSIALNENGYLSSETREFCKNQIVKEGGAQLP